MKSARPHGRVTLAVNFNRVGGRRLPAAYNVEPSDHQLRTDSARTSTLISQDVDQGNDE